MEMCILVYFFFYSTRQRLMQKISFQQDRNLMYLSVWQWCVKYYIVWKNVQVPSKF